jgi:hypothetical protein
MNLQRCKPYLRSAGGDRVAQDASTTSIPPSYIIVDLRSSPSASAGVTMTRCSVVEARLEKPKAKA